MRIKVELNRVRLDELEDIEKEVLNEAALCLILK
jgi:hypothetical protein